MFRLIEEQLNDHLSAMMPTVTFFDCHHCLQELTYHSVPPYVCEECFSQMPDITNLITNPHVRALWHSGTIGGLLNLVDNV